MSELIKVNIDDQTVSARELYKELEVTDRFSRWFDRMLAYGFVDGEDFTSVKSSTLVNNGAERELQDYQVTMDMAKHICMVQRTEKAKKVRQYLIDLEKAWNTPEQVMARALRIADQTIASLNKTVLEMKPKAEFYDQVTDSKDAIDMKDCANVLHMGIGRNKLFKFLREQKILTEKNRPYQEFVDRGYFRTVEQKYDRGYGEIGINVKTLVFQKGVDYIRKQLLLHGYKESEH